MAGLRIPLVRICIIISCVLIFALPLAKADRLNVPRVLLPVFNDFPVNFTLEVTEGGCYRWSPSREDIIRLIPINEDYDNSCSTQVIVQTVTRDPSRKTAIVLAEDITTGNFLRCDVIVDAIFSLDMVTTTRELFIEEAPEAFEVRAYDEQGNEFTTLAGIEFKWDIGNIDKNGQHNDFPNNVLRFMTYQESPYETPHSVEMLDSIGKTGNIILLEGVKTGTAKVAVKLLYPEYKHVSPVEVELIVVANLIIIPSDVTIMAFDSFTYKVVQVHQGRLEEINIPSSQYYLEAENPTVLEINNLKSSAYALMSGKTKVLLHDKNVHEEYGNILPTAAVSVSEVDHIAIAALPHRTKSLILGFPHNIIVELFDSKDHKFYIGEGIEVTMKISEKYFDKKLITQNGTHAFAIPISTGTTIVEATLHGVINKKAKRVPINPELSVKAEFIIHSAVTVYPRILALPWDPKVKTRYDVALKASGGDGSYSWSSRQPSIASVSQNGALKILQKGTADITVSLLRNPHNRDTAKVHVLTPKKLQIVQYHMEAAVDEIIYLHIALFGELHEGSDVRLIPFNDCQDLYFEVDIPDGNFIEIESLDVEPVGIACSTVAIVSQAVGTSKISVTYGRNLTDNVTVSAYEPLVVVNPKVETILAVGSSRNIIFKGGPLAFSGLSQSYEKDARVSDFNILDVSEEESYEEDVSTFKVLCKTLGEGTVTYSVHNKPTSPFCKRREAVASVRVVCAKPRYIYLQPEFKDGKSCPISHDADRIVAHSEESLRLLVIVKDENERRFDNITSLNIEWVIKPSTSAVIGVSAGSLEEVYYEYNVALPKNHYQEMMPNKYIDSFSVKAKVTGYQKNILTRLRINPEYPPFPIENEKGTIATPLIETSINVFLVNDTVIKPKRLKILNDPNSKYYLQVSQGSGYYDLVLNDEEIADVRYVEPTRTISVIPRRSGLLEIAVVDLCLSSKPAEVEIEVQQLSIIEVETVNKVEKDKFIVARLKLYDTNGYLIMLPALEALDIKIETENGYIDVKRAPTKDQGLAPFEEILYLIQGLEEGEAQLVFSSGQGSSQVRSDVLNIQVFPPLQLLPKNLTTLVGTIYQISVIGGPKNAEIEFSTDDEEVLEIDASGVIEGKTTGETIIFAKALGEDSKGNRVVYSQDHAQVRVILLEGVKIVIPTLRIKVGAVIPVWAFGIPDHLTPLIIGSMKSPLVFSWTTSDSKIMTLHNMYEGTGINVRYQNEVTLRARANKPGIATIILTATTPCNVPTGCRVQPSFSSSAKIEIFEELQLINPDTTPISLVLLMAPNSSLKLETNRDKFGINTYKVLSSGQFASGESDDSHALTSGSNDVITVDKNGILKSGEHYGSGIITVSNTETYSTKQTLTIAVYIKPIHYVMLSLKSNIRIRSGEELTMLPKSMDLDYVLECYDNVGSKFHAAEVDFKTLSSRTDLVLFTKHDKNIVNAKFIENGELIAKVFHEKFPNGMFDYVHMSIGDVLFPTKTIVTVGDIVCFSMPLLSSDGDPGYWQSSAPEILYVDPITGIGRARSPGIARVKHSIATHLRDEVDVIVNSIAQLTLVPLKGKNVTGTETFSVPLILKGKHDTVKENNVLSRGLGGCRTHSSFSLSHYPFICTIQFTPQHSNVIVKDIFYAKPRFDIVSGYYYCDIIPMGLPSVMSSSLETKLRINALSRDIEGTPIEVSYLPPMYIPTREIIFLSSLGQEVPTATLDIYGLPHVLEHVIIETPEEVSVGARQILTKNVAQFKLSLTQNQDEVQGRKIIITNELTRQNISLLIRIPKYDQFPRISGIHWVDYLYFHRYTLGTFVILAISFLHFWRNKMTNLDMSVKNKNVFAEKCSPPLKKTAPGSTSTNNASNSSSPGSPGSPLRPFSAFEPVYGDPRGFFTPNARRNRTCL